MISDVSADPVALADGLRPVLLRLARELRRETESLGVTSRQVTLLWLIRERTGLSLRELAAEERISAPALSGHVDRLERAGLLERVRSTDDRRRVGLALTDDGARLLRRVRARRTGWLSERLQGLEPAELAGDRGGARAAAEAPVTAALLALNRRTFLSLRRHRNYRLFFIGQVDLGERRLDAEHRARLARHRADELAARRRRRSPSAASRHSPSSGSSPASSPTGSTTAGS